MVNDAIDDAMDDEEAEDETEDLVNQVLNQSFCCREVSVFPHSDFMGRKDDDLHTSCL